MSLNPDELVVVHNADAKRFEININGQMAVLQYMVGGSKTLIYHHTEVPEAFEGMGVASKLAQFAMDYAKDNGYKVQPLCPYVRAWVQRHPDYASITTPY